MTTTSTGTGPCTYSTGSLTRSRRCTRPAVTAGTAVDYSLRGNGRPWAACEKHARGDGSRARFPAFLAAQYAKRIAQKGAMTP